MKGEDANKVRQETGFFIAGDGLPRYEFSDRTAKVNLDRIPKNSAARVDIKDLISHDILYDEYPDMANIQVKMETDPRNSGSFQARFDHEGKLIGGTIWVDPKSNEEQLTSTLLHEIQHWIQVKERIAEGSSTDLFEGFKSSLPHALETRRDFENALEFSNWLRKNPEKFKDNFQRVLNEYDSVSSAPMNLQVAKAFHNGDVSIKDINGFINTLNSDIDMTQNLIKTPSGFNYYRTMGEIEARDVSRRWRDIARGNLTESETFEYPPVLNMRAEHAVVDPDDPNKLTRSGALREIPKEDQLVIRRSDFSRKRGQTVASDVNYGKNF
jgi:hypothetical protein